MISQKQVLSKTDNAEALLTFGSFVSTLIDLSLAEHCCNIMETRKIKLHRSSTYHQSSSGISWIAQQCSVEPVAFHLFPGRQHKMTHKGRRVIKQEIRNFLEPISKIDHL